MCIGLSVARTLHPSFNPFVHFDIRFMQTDKDRDIIEEEKKNGFALLCSCLIVIRFHDFIFHLLSVSLSIALRICVFLFPLWSLYTVLPGFSFFKNISNSFCIFTHCRCYYHDAIAIEAVILFVFFTCTRYQTFDWLFLFLFFCNCFPPAHNVPPTALNVVSYALHQM